MLGRISTCTHAKECSKSARIKYRCLACVLRRFRHCVRYTLRCFLALYETPRSPSNEHVQHSSRMIIVCTITPKRSSSYLWDPCIQRTCFAKCFAVTANAIIEKELSTVPKDRPSGERCTCAKSMMEKMKAIIRRMRTHH